MKKHVLIWIVATFILTVIALAIVGPMITIGGIVGYLIKVVIFIAIGFVLYKPIEKKFG